MKNKKGEMGIGGIIFAMMIVVVCVAMLGSIINTQHEATSLLSVTDETTDLSATGCLTEDGQVNESSALCNITADNWYSAGDWRLSESQCYLSGITVSNDTTSLTEDTDYVVFSSIGTIQLLNTTETENGTIGNDVLLDYSYCGAGYNKDSGARGIAGLWSLFAVLIIVAGVIFYGRFKDWF